MYVHKFTCMASPCEVQLDTEDPLLGARLSADVEHEARRLEQKFSRYVNTGIVHKINSGKGKPVEVDEETAKLIDYAFECHQISEGLIDITSGVLREIWDFSSPDSPVPNEKKIQEYRARVGLKKVKWSKPYVQLPKFMQIDLGGIVKEYAVDRALELVSKSSNFASLVNFGGDIAANKSPRGQAWKVWVEGSREVVDFRSGGLATSGDARKYLRSGNRIYSHILNPTTCQAVESPFISITVEAETCTSAGILATLSHLQSDPKAFLSAQGVRFWLLAAPTPAGAQE